jgi:hypothetical protein
MNSPNATNDIVQRLADEGIRLKELYWEQP